MPSPGVETAQVTFYQYLRFEQTLYVWAEGAVCGGMERSMRNHTK